VEQIPSATAVTLYRWSQTPMASATGEVSSGRYNRVEVKYADGRSLSINEDDRQCARSLADRVAEAFGLAVELQGAPDGRRRGNLPRRDERGFLRCNDGKTETVLDEVGGELRTSTKKRLLGKDKRSFSTTDIRRLELAYTVGTPSRGRQQMFGPSIETFTLYAVVGSEEERVPIAGYTGFEGWADPEEWREFAGETARWLGVEWREESPDV
jgi:hypothetical protein